MSEQYFTLAQLNALSQLGLSLTASLNVPEILNKTIRAVLSLLQAERAALWLVEGKALTLVAFNEPAPGEIGRYPPDTPDLAEVVFQTGQPHHHLASDTLARLAAPLSINQHTLGVLEVLRPTPAFTADDEQVLAAAAQWTAIAIRNAQRYAAEHANRELAEALSEVGHRLSSTLDFETVLDDILEQIKRVVPYDTAEIILVENGRATVSRMRGYEHFEDRMIEATRQRSFDITITPTFRRMAETGEPFIVADTRHDPHWVRAEESPHVQSWVGMPIAAQPEGVIAFLSLNSEHPNFYRPEHAQRLVAFAGQAALTLTNMRLYRAAIVTAERLEQAFQQEERLRGQLIQSAKLSALGRLIASLAHEINNPLQAVQGCLTLLGEELNGAHRPEKIQRYLEVTHTEMTRVATLVARMRDFYRPSHPEMRATNLLETLENVLALTERQLREAQVQIQRRWEITPPPIQANADHLKQVFLNLILNAIDAMPHGGELRLRLSPATLEVSSELSHPALQLEFADTGNGIAPNVMLHLFEPFVTTKDSGTGLGLSISYQIIQAHNGKMTVTSAPQHGTTFSILLPFQQPGEQTDSLPVEAETIAL